LQKNVGNVGKAAVKTGMEQEMKVLYRERKEAEGALFPQLHK
jgi:hypothetical protein